MSAASRKAVTDKIVTHADGEIERLRGQVAELTEALESCERALDGHYPWPINAQKFTKKEAHMVARDLARKALAKVQP